MAVPAPAPAGRGSGPTASERARALRGEQTRGLREWGVRAWRPQVRGAMMDDIPHANITEMYRLFRTLGAVQRGRTA